MLKNEYVPFLSKITEVIRHTDIEYTFRMAYEGSVRPGQFFEVSLPKYGEAPISVSGVGEGVVDLTIRRVGKVTGEVFEKYVGDALFLRGPYGNGFQVEDYKGKELVITAGGTGLSPVRGVVEYFCRNLSEVKSLTVIAGFKSDEDILFQEDLERWRKICNLILTVDAGEEQPGRNVGLVTKFIPELVFENIADAAAVVVGPPVMMKFAAAEFLKRGLQAEQIWISHERKMCCGIGKCGHCKIDDAYVCLDGPVFNFTRGSKLLD